MCIRDRYQRRVHGILRRQNMVISTNICYYTEYRIYPGRGIKFVSKDCKAHHLINRKVVAFFTKKTKAVKLGWSQAWRRYWQKSKAEQAVKKRTKKKQKNSEGYRRIVARVHHQDEDD
eukprot:TRINITY_DN1147_c0_g1_i1.p1 TRINITY_DN1147_c0_g1~~TRINITY_DN1147_c0_g1_i1.p1  ORF type:complete len:118 (+),score=22.02 TRINITY_DN1147_c0_g1_i1:79-432(+)